VKQRVSFFRRTTTGDLIISLIVLITLIISGLLFFNYVITVEKDENKLYSDAEKSIDNLADIIKDPIWNMDEEEIVRILKLFFQAKEIVEIKFNYITNVVELKKGEGNPEYFFKLRRNIVEKGRKIATLEMIMTKEHVLSASKNTLKETLLILSVILFMIGALIKILNRFFIEKPLNTLIHNIREVAGGRYGSEIEHIAQDDINIIIDEFNDMSKKIEKREDEIRRTKKYLNNIIESMPSMLISADADGKVTQWNQAAVEYTGIDAIDAIGQNLMNLLPEMKKYDVDYMEVMKNNKMKQLPREVFKRDSENYFNISLYPLLANGAKGIVLRLDDITEIEMKDAELRQAQKMETIGTLAGGLAHDFNNVLGGVIGTLSIIRFKMDRGKAIGEKEFKSYIDTMIGSSERAADMVHQLLTLSRKQELSFAPVDLNNTIKHVVKICHNTFDKSIEIDPQFVEKAAYVNADPTQIEQVLLNLCVNASHAMTIMREKGERMGGVLTISLDTIEADQYFCSTHSEAGVGVYWVLSVNDTGIGMDTKTAAKIFDPFFTTKDKGKGTGLGLAMVYNIVKQHHGFIDIYSEKGIGSTFAVYLPILEKEPLKEEVQLARQKDYKGSGTILIVDDEALMRNLATVILSECGYSVITASDGEDGVEKFREHRDKISAVVLDLIMPKKSGDEAFREMKKIQRDVKVLLTSGFKTERRVKIVMDEGAFGFVQKPYTYEKLAKNIYDMVMK